VYARLAKYAGKDGNARPSVELLAQDLGLSRATVSRALTELTDTGWIGRKRRGRANVWDTVVNPEPRVTDDPSSVDDDSRVRRRQLTGESPKEGDPEKETSTYRER
jgi:DNA-binding transcriptional MocR family regulator